VAAYSDLGGLGTKQGPQVGFVWTMPNLLPLLLPWLAVLVLLALPSNRNPRAWWIWVPLSGLALLSLGLGEAAGAADNEGLSYLVQAAGAAAFGLAAIWLLGSALARHWRALAIALMTLAFAAVSLLALVVSPAWDQLWDMMRQEPALPLYLLIFWIASGLTYAGALNLTGWMCRSRFSGLRVSLRLLFSLWVMWLLTGSLLVGVVMLGSSGGGFEWLGFLMATIVLSLISYGLILPFLILSFASAFYRKRLRDLLRLPVETAAPPTLSVAPLVAQGGPQ
jgi:hypothetical protein